MIDEILLLAILHIGRDTSCRGEGISLRDAILRSDYKRLRQGFGSAELVPLIQANPELAKQWVMLCEDKRTNGGFWINENSFEVGTLDHHQPTVQFASLEEAVADFIVKELDLSSGLAD